MEFIKEIVAIIISDSTPLWAKIIAAVLLIVAIAFFILERLRISGVLKRAKTDTQIAERATVEAENKRIEARDRTLKIYRKQFTIERMHNYFDEQVDTLLDIFLNWSGLTKKTEEFTHFRNACIAAKSKIMRWSLDHFLQTSCYVEKDDVKFQRAMTKKDGLLQQFVVMFPTVLYRDIIPFFIKGLDKDEFQTYAKMEATPEIAQDLTNLMVEIRSEYLDIIHKPETVMKRVRRKEKQEAEK